MSVMIAPMETEARYSLAELARVTGVTPRTVRYYIAQGLLPGANEAGPGASYDADHLARLRLIRELQRQHLPLADIRQRLGGLGSDDVAALLQEQQAAEERPTDSALDYIRGILGTSPGQPRPLRAMLASAVAGPLAPAAPARGLLLKRVESASPAAAGSWAATATANEFWISAPSLRGRSSC